MRRIVLRLAVGAGVALVLGLAVGSCAGVAACLPSGTFVESGGQHVRSHGAQLCQDTAT